MYSRGIPHTLPHVTWSCDFFFSFHSPNFSPSSARVRGFNGSIISLPRYTPYTQASWLGS